MSRAELPLHHLLGRPVRDEHGVVGRIEELCAEVELHEHGRDYVVSVVRVGRYGPVNALAGPRLMQGLLRLVGPIIGYRRFEVGWDQLDLGDPRGPRLTVPRETLREHPPDATG
jgi:hypothetical protein